MSRGRTFVCDALLIEVEDTLRDMGGIVDKVRLEPVTRRRIMGRKAIAACKLRALGRYRNENEGLRQALSRRWVWVWGCGGCGACDMAIHLGQGSTM